MYAVKEKTRDGREQIVNKDEMEKGSEIKWKLVREGGRGGKEI